MERYTFQQGMEDARRLSRSLRVGRVVMEPTELEDVISFTGNTHRFRRLMLEGFNGLWDGTQWLVDTEWLSPRQRECLLEATQSIVER